MNFLPANFYHVVCMFFREELKENTFVHRAYVIDVLAELKAAVDEIAEALPSEQERREFCAAVETLGRFDHFRTQLDQQNRELLEEIRGYLILSIANSTTPLQVCLLLGLNCLMRPPMNFNYCRPSMARWISWDATTTSTRSGTGSSQHRTFQHGC